ncbi:hypothetical protein HPB52_009065 [Rhipicephalus sanguineus]|uniref:Uncharacterized protein n=1 Tax=Rhipicephalus sanguineus TaxID=34632 RepID=A0A9D4Q019_RHISA|nr:hypothetical protein HPB52_009065 [Rhipicephalus sanguineus]
MCRAVPTRKTTAAREARPRGCVARALAVREVRRSRQDYLVGRLAHRRAGVGFPGVLFVLKATTPCRRNTCVVGSSSSQNHWNSTRRPCVFRLRHGRAQPPLDDRSRRADAGFLNLPLPRCSRRAGVGFPGVQFVLKGTTPCRRNTCVVGSSSSQNHWNSTRRPCVFRLRHGR